MLNGPCGERKVWFTFWLPLVVKLLKVSTPVLQISWGKKARSATILECMENMHMKKRNSNGWLHSSLESNSLTEFTHLYFGIYTDHPIVADNPFAGM